MSLVGHERRFTLKPRTSASPPIADISLPCASFQDHSGNSRRRRKAWRRNFADRRVHRPARYPDGWSCCATGHAFWHGPTGRRRVRPADHLTAVPLTVAVGDRRFSSTGKRQLHPINAQHSAPKTVMRNSSGMVKLYADLARRNVTARTNQATSTGRSQPTVRQAKDPSEASLRSCTHVYRTGAWGGGA